MNREQIINEAIDKTCKQLGFEEEIVTESVARVAANFALDLAGFSDDEPANSPRPVENSPLNAQKKPGFGPEQTR